MSKSSVFQSVSVTESDLPNLLTQVQTSETNAANSAAAAATSAASVGTSASNAATEASNAANSATAAANSASASAASASAASTSETNASAHVTTASNHATGAAASATSATNSQAAATQSATDAATSATNAATSETNAATSATNAATSETNAATSASSASTSVTNAAAEATAAATSATAAAASESAASTSETNAQTHANTASGHATTASTQATNAATSATNAATSETNAGTQATNAATSATAAAGSATNAATAQTAAESARDSALAAFDSFDDRYLGTKTSDPSTDNDGNTLVAGTLYFNSSTSTMMLYTGSAWVAAYVSGGSFANLSGATFTGDVTVPNLITSGNVDGRDVSVDGAKLDGIAANATAVTSLTDLSITDGTNGQALKTDGNGNFSFGDVTSSVAFADITGKPTTLSGYGITSPTIGEATLSHQTDNTWRGLTITNTGDNNECTVDGKSSDGTQQFIVYGGAQAQGFLNPSTYGWRLKIPLTGSFSRDNTYTIWDSGNDGSGSGLDADLLDGLDLHTGRNNEANKVVRSNSSGYVDFGWINTTSGSTGSNTIDRVYSSYDGYIRYSSATNFINKQGLSYYRAYDWLEFRDTGAGVYWSNSTGAGWHIYPQSSAYMRVRSGHSSVGGFRCNTAGTDLNYIYWNNSGQVGFLSTTGSWILKVDNSGNTTATGNVTAYSDIRLKTDIEPIKDALDKVTNLEGIEYTRKSTGEREIGFIAQDVKEVVPELVDVIDASTEEQDALPDLHVMKYQNTTALLVEAVKELKAEVDTLRQEIAELKKER